MSGLANFVYILTSYFPNGMGLYDVVGNVAEMIDKKAYSTVKKLHSSEHLSHLNLFSGFNYPVLIVKLF